VEHALRAFLARSEGEEVEDFYARVGEFYLLAHTEFGKPTQALATAAGVPRSTATRWVHQARVRGHLPPTTRGKSRS
jgi:transposase